MPEGLRAWCKRYQQVLEALGCLLLVGSVLGLKFGNGFVWDDVPLLAENPFLFDLGNAPTLFLHDTMFASDGGAFAARATLDTYRPITLLTFMLDGWVWGRGPLGFHVTNLVLHLLVMGQVFALGLRWMGPAARRFAWIPMLWVGLHPLLGEAHVWINGRSDVLAACFALGALLILTPVLKGEARQRGWRLAAGAGLLLLGMLSKEIVVMTLPVLMFLGLGVSGRPWREWSWRVCGEMGMVAAISGALYLGLRWVGLSGLKTNGGMEHVALALWRMPRYLFEGVWRLLVPGETAVRFVKEAHDALAWGWFAGAWVGLLVVGVVWLYRVRRSPLLASGVLWFALLLAPASLTGVLAWYGFGRYLYLPATWLCVVVVDALFEGLTRWTPRVRSYGVVACGLYLGVLGVGLALSVGDWQDEAHFYAAIQRDYPEHSHGWGGWGRYLLEHGAVEASIPFLERAVVRAPGDSRYLNNLAQAKLRLGDAEGALEWAQVGMERFPDEAKFTHIAAVSLVEQDQRRCSKLLVEAIQKPQGSPVSWALISELLRVHPDRARYHELFSAAAPGMTSPPLRQRLEKLLAESLPPKP